MYFTFLTITYNHENFIIQHLESIKFQIENYGKNHEFQLIIADDHSKDNTIKESKKWLKNNAFLFKSITILENDQNLGTCKTYVKGVKNINGDYFKDLAGDDLYACENIFEAVKLLEKYDIVSTPVAPFMDNKIYFDNKIFSRIYSMYKFTNTQYDKIKKNYISIPMTPGVFMKKELLTEDVLSFISKYKFIEDRSKNIKLYENNEKLSIGRYEKILVLYRYHLNAVTKTTNNSVVNDFNIDSIRLYKYVNKNSSNILLKINNSYNIHLSKIRNSKIRTIFNIGAWTYRLNFLLNYNKYKYDINEIINNSFVHNEKHLEFLSSEVYKNE